MDNYPDNVIKFPASKKHAKNPASADDSSSEVIAFLGEMLDIIEGIEGNNQGSSGKISSLTSVAKPEPYENKYLTLVPLKQLDFDLFENKDTVEDSEVLDRCLAALADEIGSDATRKLSRIIEEYVAEVADIAFAEGLTEGAIPLD